MLSSSPTNELPTGKNIPSTVRMKGSKSPSPGRKRSPSRRSTSPGRQTRSPSPESIKFFGTGVTAFNSSGPRSALFRMNSNPSSLYDYGLTVDPNSAAYRYYTSKSAVLTKTHVPAQDTLIPRAQSPPVGTYHVRQGWTTPTSLS